MKIKFILGLIMISLFTQFSYASFPVERRMITENISTLKKENKTVAQKEILVSPAAFSEKSKGVALLLALFLGLVAAHRWYVGCPTIINIFFIMTLGGVGIWLLIDIIRIFTGDFNPKGRFKESFF